MDTYAIAVKQSQRAIPLAVALGRIRHVDGVAILDDGATGIARIRASKAALRVVESLISSICHIEPCIRHSPQEEIGGMLGAIR